MPYLYVFCECGEHLLGDHDGATEVLLAGSVDGFLAAVVPVEVHDGLLQAEQVVHGTDHDVHRRVVARLGTQVVLEFWGNRGMTLHHSCNCTSPKNTKGYCIIENEDSFVVLVNERAHNHVGVM